MIRHTFRSWSLLLMLVLAAPVSAQEEMPAEDAAVEETPADAAPGESIPVDEYAPADEAAPPADDLAGTSAEEQTTAVQDAMSPPESVETIPVETEAEPEEEAEPWRLYAGLDFVKTTVGTEAGDVDSGMYRLRVGRRVFDQIAVEFQYGADNGNDGTGEVETDSYFGLYAVPMALALETVELAFPIGYAMTKVGDESLSSIAYGFNAELPLRGFGEELPDLRVVLGWNIYHQSKEARVYGANLGLRYDFTTSSLGNPFGWMGDLDLWPFGDDEESAEAAE